MTEITITIPGIPIGQPRHRVNTRNGMARQYLPCRHPIHAYKKAIKLAIGKRRHLHGAVAVEVTFVFPRPNSKTWKKKPMPRYRHTAKPDIDNLCKAVLDACNKSAFSDDAQVCGVTAEKWVCSGNEQPRTNIRLIEIEDFEL